MAKKITTPTPATRILWPYILLGLAACIMLYTRLALLNMPLERDEGGYAYIGHRLFSGPQRLYTDMLDIKLPGLYALYWLFDQLPGAPAARIHLGLLLVHCGALVLFYRLIQRIVNAQVAAVATALFAISAVMPGVYGFATHATQLLQLPLMGALLLLWDYGNSVNKNTLWRVALSGFLLGIAFTIKQPAIVFIVFAIGVLLLDPKPFVRRIGNAFVLGMASLVPFLSIAGYFWSKGRFDDFWLWTFTVPTAQTVGGDTMFYLETLVPRMIGNHWLFWLTGVLSMAIIPFTNYTRQQKSWIVGLLAVALLSAAIGLGFMPHYFIPAIPWAAAGIAMLLEWKVVRFFNGQSTIHAAVAAVFVLSPAFSNSAYFFRPDPVKIMEQCYHWNGFPEIQAISKELKKRLKPGETIAILGSEPQINYYTNTEHCSPHLFMYPVIRPNARMAQFQQQFIQDLQQCNAAYVVVTASEASWVPQFAETPFFKRDLMAKVTENYTLIGRANIGQMPMSIVWDEALKTHNPPKCPPIFIFKHK